MARDSTDSEPPTGKRQRDWVLLWRVVVVTLAFVAASGGAVLLFAGKAYVKEAAAEQLAEIPLTVKSLEEARIRQDRDQRQMATTVSVIQQDIAAIRATQSEATKNNDRNTERILNRLEQIADRR